MGCHSSGDLLDPGTEPRSPALQSDSLLTERESFVFSGSVKVPQRAPPTTPFTPCWENESKVFGGGGSVPHPELLYLQGCGEQGAWVHCVLCFGWPHGDLPTSWKGISLSKRFHMLWFFVCLLTFYSCVCLCLV